MINQTNRDSGYSPVNEGWSVVVYNGDRRLLCSLHPSHGWIFAIGLGLGCVLGIIWTSLSFNAVPTTLPLESPASSAPMQID
ncbi:MAG: hypothetical protein AAFR31_07020 [Cyanobacteria bacterium J06627_8]